MDSESGEHLPTAIGRYQIRSLLGRGGMGEVYGAFDPHLDRHVALKTIQPGHQDKSLVERLQLEARAIGRLQHRGIVTIYDLGESQGKLFIAMEWLQGRSLAQAIKAGDLTFSAKLRILMEVLEALAYAHSQGIIHRDIKPSNVWVQPDGQVKLLDFGLARFTQTEGLTLTGDVMGTPLYMSPEQLKGHAVDARSDVYSCGVTGYELLSRRRPFDGESITAIIIKVLGDTPPPLGTAWSIALPDIEALIAKAMSKAPEDRFATATEMAAALRAFLKNHEDDIQRIDKELALEATLIIHEVQALRSRGLEQEATGRLKSALDKNPDATELRTLMGENVGAYSPVPRPPDFRAAPNPPVLGAVPIPPAPIASAPPAQPPVPPAVAPPVPPPLPPSVPSVIPAAVASSAAFPPAPAPAPVPVAIPAPIVESRHDRKNMSPALIGIAAVVLIGGGYLLAQFMGRDGGQSTDGPKPSPVAPLAATLPKESPTPTATATPSVTTPVETPSPAPLAVPSPPVATPASQSAPPSTDNATGLGQGRPVGRGNSVGGRMAGRLARGEAVPPLVAADLAGFFVNETSVPALRTDLMAQLRELGLSPAARPGAARWIVTVTGEVEIRSAAVGSGSGLTADYSGGVELLDRRLRRTGNQSFEGHVLDFGRVVVRTRAERELAEKIASYVTTTIKSWQ